MQVAGPQVNITYENLLFHVGSGPCAEYDLLTGEMFFENGAEGFSSVLRGDIFQISVPSFSWVYGRRAIYKAHFLANISIILSQMQIISLETVTRRKYVHSSAPENLWHWRKKLRNDVLATMHSTLSSHFTIIRILSLRRSCFLVSHNCAHDTNNLCIIFICFQILGTVMYSPHFVSNSTVIHFQNSIIQLWRSEVRGVEE